MSKMAQQPARRIAVLGGGAWGTALANLAARAGAQVILWTRDPAHAAEIAATGFNARRLPGVPLLANVTATSDLALIQGADIVLLAVPAQTLRETAARARPHIAPHVPVIICAKGIERATGLFMSDVIAQTLPDNPPAVLSGPSFAEDVARGLPTAVTLAARDAEGAEALAAAFAAPWFRLYHTADIRGVEIGGSVKNVLAIACGIAAGRGLGKSAGAALIARGFAELTRFGRALGADPGTLMGLAGLGDLVLTCGSTQSRNYSFGFALGQGVSVEDAQAAAGTVEGAQTCGILVELARRQGVDMPIAQAVESVLTGRVSVEDAITALLARPAKAEARF
jgi:glycerol-3-phosphate dehydrogenase (NAD(P)+)